VKNVRFIHIIVFISIVSCTLSCTSTLKLTANEYGWNEQTNCIDFDISMKTTQYGNAINLTKQVTEIDGQELLKFFRNLYNKNNLSRITPNPGPKIPKIIHHVWIGSKVPKILKKYMITWVEKHLGRDWKYILWTDEQVAKITLNNQNLYDESINYGVKSDILKYEIIYRYGGVYVDTDFECLKGLDILHHCYDFYVGIQPLDTQYLQLGAALFGASPGHPILKHTIDTLPESYKKHKGAPNKTGPIHFTRAFLASADKSNLVDIALPASYFYPFGAREQTADREKWKKLGAFAIHWWGMTWMPIKYRRSQFKSIQNEENVQNWNT